jgi:hypothetical protein
MATFTFTSPDGKSYDVDGPEGATQEQAFAVLQQRIGGQPTQASATPEDHGIATNLGYGALRGVQDIGNTIVNAGAWVGNKIDPGVGEWNDARNQSNAAFFDERANTDSTAFGVGRIGANIAATAPLASLKVLKGAGKAAAWGNRAISGAAQGTAISGGEDVGQAAGVGAIAGVAAPALGRLISPRPAKDVTKLMGEGVTPTIGQRLGGVAKNIEDKLTSWPVIGNAIDSARQGGMRQFYNAAMNRALKPIGKELPKDVEPGRDAFRYVSQQMDEAYDAIKSKIHFAPDGQFSQEMGQLVQMSRGFPQAQQQQFMNIVRQNLQGRATPQGRMNGESFKTAESEIGRKARGYMGDPSFDNRQLGEALGEVQRIMRATLERSNPAHAKELKRINEAYANFAVLRRASAGLGAEGGIFTPAQLQNAVKASDRSAGKGNFARGNALLQDLSEAGKNVLPSKYPDSGTAGRLSLGFLGDAAVSVPAVVGSVPYLPGARRATNALLTSRPQFAKPLAQNVNALAPYAIPALAQGLASNN